MNREEFLESLIRRVQEAKGLEDIEAVFKEAYGLDDDFLKFYKRLAAIQNGEQPVFNAELAQYLESLDTESAIDHVGQYFSTAFHAWRKNPQGSLPLLVLERKIGEEIGAKSQIVLLSSDTLKKQDEHHPELTQADYDKAQEAVTHGEKLKQDALNLAFVTDSADGMVVVVKATRIGDELYATSLRRMSEKDILRERTIRKLRKGKS